jgi:hypothetical protein
MTAISDAITANFPFPFVTMIGRITAYPTFTLILTTHEELNANASSIFSSQGDGIHGLLVFTISK